MTEECQNCGKSISKYIILDIAEFVDHDYNDDDANVNIEDLEVRNYTSTTLCIGCWSEAKECSVILHQAIKRP